MDPGKELRGRKVIARVGLRLGRGVKLGFHEMAGLEGDESGLLDKRRNLRLD